MLLKLNRRFEVWFLKFGGKKNGPWRRPLRHRAQLFLILKWRRMAKNKEIDFDEELVSAITRFPVLYDHSLPDFKKFMLRENAWAEVAKETGKSGMYILIVYMKFYLTIIIFS